jgi:hypothetical protein
VLSLGLCLPLAAAAQTPDPAASGGATPAVQSSATPADPLAKQNWPVNFVDRPAGLSAGMLQVDLWSFTSMSKELVGKPVSFPLAAYYGVSNELQLGIVPATITGMGLCVTGKDNGCVKAYNDIAFQGVYSITGRGSAFELAGFGQLNFARLSDPMLMNLQLGTVLVGLTGGNNLAFLAYPSIGIGLNKRDMGNKEYVSAPLYVGYRVTPNLSPILYTGLFAPFDGFGDGYIVPVGIGALYGVSAMWDVGARFDFTNLLGKVPDGTGRADGRALNVWVSVRPL